MGAFKYTVYALGVLFVVAGGAKICPAGRVHEEMTKAFVRFSSVFPLVSYGIKPDPGTFQFIVGAIEFIGGTLLLAGSLQIKKFCAAVLLPVMAGASYSLLLLNEPMAQVAFPVAVGVGLVAILFQKEDKAKED